MVLNGISQFYTFIRKTCTPLKQEPKNGENKEDISVDILAPIPKKHGAGPTAKSGAGLSGKSIGSKPMPTFNSTNKASGSGSVSKPPSVPSTSFGKSYNMTPSMSTPKGTKKTTFSLLWIPSRRNNPKKDVVWQTNNYSNYKERMPTMYNSNFMSGDSQAYKKKEEEVNLLLSQNKPPVAMNVGTTVTLADAASDTRDLENIEDKQEFAQDVKEESKEAAGDTNDKDSNSSNKDYLENKGGTDKYPENVDEKRKDYGDKVDSVYLRPPPPGKTRSTASPDDDECGIKCLYYTLQCCDCVIM